MALNMSLSSLLVCMDDATAAVLRRALQELSIRVESCPDLGRAGIRLAQQRFDLLIIDCDSKEGIAALLRETQVSRMNDSTLAVVVMRGPETIHEMFSLGANFVLYKPVDYERALSSLRAAHALTRKDKRRKARAAVHAHATVDYANVEQERATLIDLAEDGMAVFFGKKIPPTNRVYFQFRLPAQTTSVRLSGQVMWQDWNGRAGIQFVDVPKASRRLISEFLTANLREAPEGIFSVSTVTVELGGLPQSAPVEVAATAKKPEEKEQSKAEAKAAVRLRSAPDNRRGQARYDCHLGAEVYRTGNPVPNHCSLTDLSAGGCYLEMPIPLAKGLSIEITVRTYEMKLRLRGVVQASHPGYGMGIAFVSNTNDDRHQVQMLIDYVAAMAQSAE
jgi:CheY-like chemotaxis protein